MHASYLVLTRDILDLQSCVSCSGGLTGVLSLRELHSAAGWTGNYIDWNVGAESSPFTTTSIRKHDLFNTICFSNANIWCTSTHARPSSSWKMMESVVTVIYLRLVQIVFCWSFFWPFCWLRLTLVDQVSNQIMVNMSLTGGWRGDLKNLIHLQAIWIWMVKANFYPQANGCNGGVTVQR